MARLTQFSWESVTHVLSSSGYRCERVVDGIEISREFESPTSLRGLLNKETGAVKDLMFLSRFPIRSDAHDEATGRVINQMNLQTPFCGFFRSEGYLIQKSYLPVGKGFYKRDLLVILEYRRAVLDEQAVQDGLVFLKRLDPPFEDAETGSR